jgi:hypothetical protein
MCGSRLPQVVPGLLGSLPLREDFAEAEAVFSALAELATGEAGRQLGAERRHVRACMGEVGGWRGLPTWPCVRR